MNKLTSIAFLFLLTAAACSKSQTGDTAPPDKACTEEAKECPDGSTVVRAGPDCEFAACPDEGGDEPVACTEEAKECPDGSTVAREGADCEFAACPDDEAEAVACPDDEKKCPDGSFVSREAPDCEFAECP